MSDGFQGVLELNNLARKARADIFFKKLDSLRADPNQLSLDNYLDLADDLTMVLPHTPDITPSQGVGYVLEVYNLAVQRNIANVDVWHSLGAIYYSLGKFEEAIS
ncbi:MAG: tetratricopeptide repeat protein, partial [Nanoarchaeota archaeon]